VIWTGTDPGSMPAVLYGVVDWRNNIAINASTVGSASLVAWGGTRSGIWDYNAYAAINPSTGLFGQTSSCCTWAYTQWKANTGADAHSPAIFNAPGGTNINLSTGVPNSGSPVIGAGTNLTSLGISALNADRNGNPRPSSGAWDIGAFNSGASVTTTKPSPPTGLTVVVH